MDNGISLPPPAPPLLFMPPAAHSRRTSQSRCHRTPNPSADIAIAPRIHRIAATVSLCRHHSATAVAHGRRRSATALAPQSQSPPSVVAPSPSSTAVAAVPPPTSLRLHHRSLNRRVATRHLFPDPVALPPPFCPAAVAQLSSSYPSAICGSPSRCRNNHLMRACKFFLCINRTCWRLSCSLLRPALCVALPRQLGVQRFALGVSPGPVYVLCAPCQGSRFASAEAMLFSLRSALGIPVVCKLIVQRARSADPGLASGRPDVPLTAVST